MKKTIIFAAAICLSSVPSFADEVGPTTTFTSGTPAVADDVNGNFEALISAINDNATRIAALEAASTDNLVAGHTYTLHALETGLAATDAPNPNSFSDILAGGAKGTYLFHTSGNTGVQNIDYDFLELYVPTNNTNFSSENTETTFTYTQVGSTVTVTHPDPDTTEVVTLTASADGSMLVGVFSHYGPETFGANEIPGFSGWIRFIVLMRND